MISSGLGFLKRFALLMLLAGIVAGCAAPGKIGPDTDTAFQRTGRFAITVKSLNGAQDAVQGGFAWQDTGSVLTLDLANPLGTTLARVTVRDGGAMLTHSNGAHEYAADADSLVEKVLGSPVPVSGLRDWLHGKTGNQSVHDVQHDSATDQLTGFIQQGWRVRLSRYDALGPTVLQMNRNDAQRDISVRLAISAQSESP